MKNYYMHRQDELVGRLLSYDYEVGNSEPTIASKRRIWNVLDFVFSHSNAPDSESLVAKIYQTAKAGLEKTGYYKFSQKQLGVLRSWLSHKEQASLLSDYMAKHQQLENRTEAQKVADNYNNSIEELALAIVELQKELERVKAECRYWQERVPFADGGKNFLNNK